MSNFETLKPREVQELGSAIRAFLYEHDPMGLSGLQKNFTNHIFDALVIIFL